MDIWAWVDDIYDELHESGHERLAQLLYEIPNDLHNKQYARIDSTISEAIAGARALKNPWLEVFFRHWSLRNRLSNYGEGESALAEAADLMDFANQESTQECPQSICVTQDLAGCYANLDGPNWVEERLAVCQETIAKIGPERNCFDCISREISSAHKANKDYQTADRFLKEQAIIMRKAGNEPCGYYINHQADTALRLGNIEEAEQFLEELKKGALEDSDSSALMLSYHMTKTDYHLVKGEYDEAEKTLPKWPDLSLGEHDEWVGHVLTLAKHKPHINTWGIGSIIMESLQKKIQYGAHRDVFEMTFKYIELALLRQANTLAKLVFPQLKEAQQKLRYPEKEDGRVRELEARVMACVSSTELPVPAEQLLDYLASTENRDPEVEIAWLQQAAQTARHHLQLQVQYAYALSVCGLNDLSKKHLWSELKHNDLLSDKESLVYHLCEQTYDAKPSEWNELIQYLHQHYPEMAVHHQIIKATKDKDWELVEKLVEQGERLKLDILWLQRYLVNAYTRQSKFKPAQEVLLQREKILTGLNAETEEDKESIARQINNVVWDIIAFSTAIKDWEMVHNKRKIVDVAVPNPDAVDEPIDDRDFYETAVHIRVFEDGEETYLYGHRNGPSSARIRSISFDNKKQYANDWVVFEPTLIEPYPEDPEEQENFIPSFDMLSVLEKGNKIGWSIYAPYSSSDKLEQLLESFVQQDWMVSVRIRREDFFYVQIATSNTDSPNATHLKLKQLTADWGNTLCYKGLAEKSGIDKELHEQLADQYNEYF